MSYSKHLFFCTNQREGGAPCCNNFNSTDIRNYAKQKCQQLGIHGAGKVRINSSGCLGQCANAPVVVVYPDAVWYTWTDTADIDEIIESHLLNDNVVERLLIGGTT